MDFALGLEGSNGMGSQPSVPHSLPYVEERNSSIFFGDFVLFWLEQKWGSRTLTVEVTERDLPKRTHKAKKISQKKKSRAGLTHGVLHRDMEQQQ